MTVAQGDRVPDVDVQTMGEEGPTTVSTGEVLGPPAPQGVGSYKVRVNGPDIELEL